MTQHHYQFIATATAQSLTMLESKEIDREALRAVLRNLNAFARDHAVITRPYQRGG